MFDGNEGEEMKTIIPQRNEEHLAEAISKLRASRKVIALTGAGISVASGIPDFRSSSGLWSRYAPEEYATIKVFYENPEKAWKLYRDMGLLLLGKKPNRAHCVLKKMEDEGKLAGIVTQNVDNLHQLAGNKKVFEIHGDHQHLQCLSCGALEQVRDEHYSISGIPTCEYCSFPLKPNIVLFGEPVRALDEIMAFIQGCDLLLVIGTSAQVYPAAELPFMVKQGGGMIFEFNREPALATGAASYIFKGDLGATLPALYSAL